MTTPVDDDDRTLKLVLTLPCPILFHDVFCFRVILSSDLSPTACPWFYKFNEAILLCSDVPLISDIITNLRYVVCWTVHGTYHTKIYRRDGGRG
jgi:hypothetical protein